MSHAAIWMLSAVMMVATQSTLVVAFGPSLQLHSRAALGLPSNSNMASPTCLLMRPERRSRQRSQGATFSMQSDDSSEKSKLQLPDADKVMENMMNDGTPGQRGELYVGLQFLLVFLVFIAPAFEETFYSLGLIAGLAIVAVGLGVGGVGVLQLGDSLTPWPKPTSKNELQTTGSYSLVRHPIYSGLVVSCFGLSLITLSFPRLFFTIILFLVLDVKSGLEEEWLSEIHPSYKEYQTTTPKLIPTDPAKLAAVIKDIAKSLQ